MRNRHFYAILLAFFPLFLQAQIQFTAGIPYRLGAPSTAPSTTGSRFQVDLNTQRVYQWSPTLVNWVRVADGITVISGTAPPSYTPVDNQSIFAINAAGEFWYYNGATWETPGVPVSISSRLSGDGLPGTPLDLAQQGATTGQVLKWSGTAWTPAADAGTTYTAGTGIDVTGTVISNTGDLSTTNELQTYSHSGTTSYTNTLSNSGGSFTLQSGTGITLAHTAGTTTITNSGDLSTTNELQTLSTGSNSLTLSNGGGTVTVDTDPSGDLQTTLTSGNIFVGNGSNVATGVAMSGDATITNAGVVTVDKVDNTQVVATGATNGQVLKWNNGTSQWEPGNDGGTTYTAGTGIDVTGTVISNTGDLSTTNEGSLTVAAGTGTTSVISSNTSGSTAVTLTAGTGLSISETGNTITLANTGDLSTTNELQTLSTGSNSLTLSNGGGTVTVDTDPANELQTYGHSGTTSYTNTLSNSGGSFTLQSGTGITLAHTAGTTTITNSGDLSATNEGSLTVGAGTGTTSVISSNTSGSTDVTLTAGTGLSISEVGNTITLANTGDLSTTNELQTLSTGTNSLTLSNGGGTVTVDTDPSGDLQTTLTSGNIFVGNGSNVATGVAMSGDATITNAGVVTVDKVDNTQVVATGATDGQVLKWSNANTRWEPGNDVGGGAGDNWGSQVVVTDATLTGNGTSGNALGIAQQAATSGQVLKWSGTAWAPAADANTTYTAGTGIDVTGTVITNTGDLAVTNEGSLTVAAGTGTTSVINSNTSGSTAVTMEAGTGLSISETGNTITLTNTGDLSATNELQTYGHSGTTSYTNTLSNSGGSFTLQSGTGITLSHTAGTTTITNSGDLSTTNEGSLTVGAGSGTTSVISSNTSGSTDVTLTAGTGLSISEVGNVITLANSGDLAATNEGSLTVAAGSGTTSVISSNTSGSTDVTLTVGTGLSISETGNTITLANTGDLSATNEGSLTVGAGTGTTSVISSNTSGSTDVTLAAGSNVTISETGNTITIAAAGGGTDFAAILGYVEGVTGTSVDLDALDGNTKDIDGTNLAFTIPSNLANFKVYKNGVELNRTGTGTTRDYSANNTTNVLTLQVALESTDRLVVQSVTGSSPDIYTSAEITGAGTIASPLKLAQQSATSGQVLAWTGTQYAPTTVTFSPSVISPAQITGDQDNYNPTGFDAATLVRVSSDNFRAITSFAAQADGEEKTILNVGSFPIYLPGQHPDGTAANRIITPYDMFLFPGKPVKIVYDNTAARWYVLGQRERIRAGAYYETSFGSITAGDWGTIAFTSSGTAAAAAAFTATSAVPGGVSLGTGSTNAGFTGVSFSKTVTNPIYISGSHISGETTVSVPTLSDGTETYTAGIMVTASPTSATFAPNNSVGIRYTNGVNSGKWLGFTKNNAGTETTVDLGVTVAAATAYKLRVEIDKQNTEARFYVDGVMAGVVNTNMPTANTAGFRTCILKSAGTTSRSINAHSMLLEAIY